jgi:hypothetical protein
MSLDHQVTSCQRRVSRQIIVSSLFLSRKCCTLPLCIRRNDVFDPDTGSEKLETTFKDVYPFGLVDETSVDDIFGIKGSCKDYEKRKDITSLVKDTESLNSVLNDNGGAQHVVVVADQWNRGKALLGEFFCPFLMQSISALQWCLLERIGRSRALGEGTIGKHSLQFSNESPKSIFYQTKSLLKSGIIRKQMISQFSNGNRVTVIS